MLCPTKVTFAMEVTPKGTPTPPSVMTERETPFAVKSYSQ